MPAVELNDVLKVGLLIMLEAVMSADNAIVLAVLVLPLAPELRGKALWYGIFGAFAFRVIAVVLAVFLMQNPWVILVGGIYLLYLPVRHFMMKARGHRHEQSADHPAKTLWGLSRFWTIVILVQLTDMAFSIDSILAAVAMSRKVWVVVTGGILGIITMRFVTGKFLKLVERFPTLVDGAHVIVLWLGIKLVIEFMHRTGLVVFEITDKLYLSIIGVIFIVSLLMQRRTPEQIDETIEESITVLAQNSEGE